MNNCTSSASHASRHAPRQPLLHAVLLVGFCLSFTSLALPWMSQALRPVLNEVDGLQACQRGLFAPLPADRTARPFAGIEAR